MLVNSIAQSWFNPTVFLALVMFLVLTSWILYALQRYKRCPANKILVIYGKVAGGKTSVCIHGGGAFVLPVIQDYQYMSLEPMPIQFDARMFTSDGSPVELSAQGTVVIGTTPELMQSAAERLLGLERESIVAQATDIVRGHVREAVASRTAAEVHIDGGQNARHARQTAGEQLALLGLEVLGLDLPKIDVKPAAPGGGASAD